MKLSTKGRYGTRVLLDLALHQGEGPAPLKDIAKRQQISLQYLEHLIAPLIAGGMVRSIRGSKGGILLARAPEQIKMSEVIQLLEGSIAPVDCVDNPAVCSRSESCVSRDLWSEMKEAMEGILEATTLQNMVERHREKEKAVPAMYYV